MESFEMTEYFVSYPAEGELQYSLKLGDLTDDVLQYLKNKTLVDEQGTPYVFKFHTAFELLDDRQIHGTAIRRTEDQRRGKYNPIIVALYAFLVLVENFAKAQSATANSSPAGNDSTAVMRESKTQTSPVVSPPVTKPVNGRRRRKKYTEEQWHKAIGLVVNMRMSQSDAETKSGLYVGALSSKKGKNWLQRAEEKRISLDRRKVSDDIGNDYKYGSHRSDG
jgi:hypothetical protein